MMKAFAAWIIVVSLAGSVEVRGQGEKVRELERRLQVATNQIEQLTEAMASLQRRLARLEDERSSDAVPAAAQSSTAAAAPSASSAPDSKADFIRHLIAPDLGGDQRDSALTARPEVFIQSRYSVLPLRDAGSHFEPNFSLTRIETRWSGRLGPHLGVGLELQYHPAPDGSPEEVVNDAFLEYYVSEGSTLRVGQFIKPFGFDIQQSSAVRESPERAIFAGYFFPGQRDRGIVLAGNLDFLGSGLFKNVQYHLGAFNGNRFFADSNRQLNYLARLRKVLDEPKLAFGFSLQRGKQLLRPGISGNSDENIVGVDVQYAIGRVGLRGELVAGNRPSTLLGIDPEFAPAFRPGVHSSGGHLSVRYRITATDNAYARYDQFNGDPVTGRNVRAFNLGYFRQVGTFSRVSFDYQFKNRPSFNDDAVNGKLNVTWGVQF